MSGGSFDYAFERVAELADQIETWEKNNNQDFETRARTRGNIEFLVSYLRACSTVSKAMEWWVSCDTSEEQFNKECEEAFKDLQTGRFLSELSKLGEMLQRGDL